MAGATGTGALHGVCKFRASLVVTAHARRRAHAVAGSMSIKAEQKVVTYVARLTPLLLLVLGKSARCASLFTAGDLLFHSQIPLPLFVEIVLALAAAVLLLLYQPWRGASRSAVLPARWPILAHGACMACTLTLWCYGLTHCGPVRTLLLDYTEPFAVFLGAAAWSATPATRDARRAATVLAGAYLLLLLTHGMHHHHHTVAAYRAAREAGAAHPATGGAWVWRARSLVARVERTAEADEVRLLDSPALWAETLRGELALVAAAALTALRKRLSRRLAGEVGGPRRLHALVTAAAALLLAPHAAWAYLHAGAAERTAWLGSGAALLAGGALALCGLVLNYHVDAAMQARLTPADAASLGLGLSLGAAAGLERLYDCPTISWLTCVCALLAALGTRQLLASQASHERALAARAAQLPLYGARLASRAPASGRSSLAAMARGVLTTSRDSRRLTLFLLLNLAIMVLEAVAGVYANSLALLSDAAHMLFDCAAIATGLFGAYAARWPPRPSFPFGLARCEPLAAFVNALLLLLAGASVLLEAVGRLREPQLVDEAVLLPVTRGGCNPVC